MGYLSAVDMVEHSDDIDHALHWHLRSNHFPPIPLSMLPVCKQAIKHANDKQWDVEVPLPEGVTFMGKDSAPVARIIDGHNLEAFLEVNQ